jgi:hypothetical protein
MISKITVIFAIFPEKPFRRREYPSRLTSMESISYGTTYSIFISSTKRVRLTTLV